MHFTRIILLLGIFTLLAVPRTRMEASPLPFSSPASGNGWAVFQPVTETRQDSLTLSLQETVERALENNQQVRDAEFELQIAESGHRQAKSGFLPQVNVEAQYQNNIQLPVIFLPPGSPFGDVLETGTTHSLSINAQVTQPLFNASLIRGISLSRATRELSRRLLEASHQEIVTEVQRAYINILLSRQSLEALRMSLERREQDLELVRSLVEQQVSPEFDLIRTGVQVENLRPQVRQAENALTGAKNYLRLLTGIPMNQPIRLSGTLQEFYKKEWRQTPLRVTEENLLRNPDLVQLEAQLEVTREQHRLNQAAYYPSLSLVGVNMRQSQGDEFQPFDYNWIGSTFIGVNLSIPIFGGLQRKYESEQSRIRIHQQMAQRDYLLESVEAEYDNARNRMLLARESVQAQQLNVEQAERGYEIARVGYENGTQNLIEVNDAELAVTDARLNWLQSIHEYIDASLELENLLGMDPLLMAGSPGSGASR